MGKTTTTDSNPKIAQDKLAHNENLVYLSRVFTSILFGVMAGVFGYTGMQGFGLFLLSSLFTSLLTVMMLPRFSIQGVFTSWASVWLGGFLQAALTFILCWALAYDSVYIFQ